MNIGRNMVKILMLAANLLAVALMIFSMIAAKVSPEKLLLPAYASLVLPVTVLVNIFFIIFWLLFRKWLFLLSLIMLLVSYSIVKNVFPLNISPKVKPDGENSFSVMTYNTHANDMMMKHTDEKPNRIIRYMLDKNPDIICIQEYSISDSKAHLTAEDIKKAFKSYPYRFIKFKLETSWSSFGVAIFSKFPIVKSSVIDYESGQNLTAYADINLRGKMVRVYNCHLETNKLTESDYIMANRLKDNPDAENIKGATLHFSKKLGAAYPIRARQAETVAASIAGTDYPVIVAGDFNDVPASYAYSRIRGDLNDAFEQRGFGLGWTFNASMFRFRIDHILFDKRFELLDFELDKKADFSDHFPLICRVNLGEPDVEEKETVQE